MKLAIPFMILILACGWPRPVAAGNPNLVPGVWKNVTPPDVTTSFKDHVFCQGVTVDPKNPATVYLCVCAFDAAKGGLFKTTDSGATWKKIGPLDEPLHVAVNPNDSKHLYCVDGVRGKTLGFWVSKDGGGSWSMPDGFKKATEKPVGTRDLYSLAVDPADFKHVLVSFHSPWADGKNCGVLESNDGGESWTAHAPPPTLKGGYGMAIFFLFDPVKKIGDKNTWLFTAQEGGFFKTTDGGKTWANVYKNSMTHGGNQLHRAKDGTLYSGGYQYPARSTDNGSSWEQVKKGLVYSWYMGVCGDGENIYIASSSKSQPFFVSPETDGLNWKPLNDQKFSAVPFEMAYDPINKILYSASWEEGLLAIKLGAGKQ
ncbi:WD40/YVTN/BNR-like repeat-containing protein [Zavarzinella formosa]|uniref:WD40/YVTN/BNR-like repeat-containing protein n=1 Tax=Zavarzinella formosa TaxID=360055 RepID=UPI00030536DB|nr:sialidase family protein [Zavarzinella formosa]